MVIIRWIAPVRAVPQEKQPHILSAWRYWAVATVTTGIEMQILDDDRHADGARRETSAGSCYALYPPTADVVRPVGEYNEVRIVVRNGNVEHWLNGVKIVAYTIGSTDWSARVAASKFADWQHFARYRKGHIALQDHTDRVWFRNIRLRQL